MSWETEITEQVRVLINDLDSSTYVDHRIERVILIAANQVIQEVQFPTEYSIDIVNADITPDPTELESKDYAFINLTALKTACLILNGELKQYSLVGGVSVTDGPSSINMSTVFNNLKELVKNMSNEYAKYKMEYKMSQSSVNSQVVITPTTNLNNYLY